MGHKILVADDDSQLLATLALHLRNEEYEVVCSSNGFDALTTAQREDPDVLLINVDLTIDDHSSLYDELLEHRGLMHIPVIYLVGERTVSLGGAPELPAQSVIFKPVPTSELFAKIDLAISGAFTGRPAIDFARYDDEFDVDDDGNEPAA